MHPQDKLNGFNFRLIWINQPVALTNISNKTNLLHFIITAFAVPALLFTTLSTLLMPATVSATPLDRISINGYLSVEYERNISGDQGGRCQRIL